MLTDPWLTSLWLLSLARVPAAAVLVAIGESKFSAELNWGEINNRLE